MINLALVFGDSQISSEANILAVSVSRVICRAQTQVSDITVRASPLLGHSSLDRSKSDTPVLAYRLSSDTKFRNKPKNVAASSQLAALRDRT